MPGEAAAVASALLPSSLHTELALSTTYLHTPASKISPRRHL